MNKKNILTAAVSLSLVACLSIGATLAYFTDKTETAQNVFTTGNVNITLIDETEGPQNGDQWVANENENNGITFSNVMPGDDLSKNVGVQIDERSSNCYVALQVAVSSNKDVDLHEIVDQIKAEAEANNWYVYATDNLLRCYYQKELVPMTENLGAELFSEIDIPDMWGNEYADATLNITVAAAAVQSANLEAPNAAMNSSSVVELDKLLDEQAGL